MLCSGCNEDKPHTEFYWKETPKGSRTRKSAKCKKCYNKPTAKVIKSTATNDWVMGLSESDLDNFNKVQDFLMELIETQVATGRLPAEVAMFNKIERYALPITKEFWDIIKGYSDAEKKAA